MKSMTNGGAIIARTLSNAIAECFALGRGQTALATVLAVTMACLSSGATAQTVVLRVDGENGGLPQGSPHNGTADGSDWGDKAFLYLQDALSQADDELGEGAELVEIWVAAMQPGNGVECGEGAYRPDLGANYTEGDHTARFELRNNVELYGGFPPGGSVWDARNTYANETILTGEIWHCDSGQCPQHEDPTTPPNCTIADVVVAAEDVG